MPRKRPIEELNYKAGTGRPKGSGQYDFQVTVRVTDDDHAWLTAEADRLDISVAELLRRLIQAARSPK